MVHVAKTDVFQIPSVSRDKPSQAINWRSVVSDIASEPEIPRYPIWARTLIFVGFGLGGWAAVFLIVGAVS